MSSVITFRKLVCHTLSSDFRRSTAVVKASVDVAALKPKELLVRNCFAGINASDVNYTAGKYRPGVKPPFDTGFEAVAEVVAVGPGVTAYRQGDAVAVTSFGTFAEYQVVKAATVFPLPDASPKYLPLIVSGLTASIALEQVGQLQAGETVLVTAAAGATGAIAVQLAALAGCTVIGTVGSDEKVAGLKALGCSRVINYNKEDLGSVLAAEYPRGIDVVYESVGGAQYEV
jgi:NADPH:quinone reductase-like Zn-dependent oxidoreductase